MARFILVLTLAVASVTMLRAQDAPPFQTDFPAEEFAQRRGRVMDAIGAQAIAIVQGAPGVDGFKVFRQSNEFYYLTGLETPHAYLVLDGRTRRTTLFLSRRNEAMERSTGKNWSAEDAAEVTRLTGVDAVAPVELLSRQTFTSTMLRAPRPLLLRPVQPGRRRGSEPRRAARLSSRRGRRSVGRAPVAGSAFPRVARGAVSRARAA